MRALTVVLVVAGAMVLALGCGPKKEQVPPLEPGDVQPATTASVAPPPPPVSRAPVMVESLPPPPPPPAKIRTTASEKPSTEKSAVLEGGAQKYTVQKGDTLYSLAKRFYGDGKAFTRIYEANKDKIKDKDHVAVGTVLVIPAK